MASMYFSEVREAMSLGSSGAGGFLSQPTEVK
jgi:hypothetical protein